MNKIYSDQIAKATSLSDGIKRNVETLKRRSIDLNTEAMDSICKQLVEASNKQEEAEQALKLVRDEAHSLLEQLKTEILETKTPIKTTFPPEQWQQFGIADKR